MHTWLVFPNLVTNYMEICINDLIINNVPKLGAKSWRKAILKVLALSMIYAAGICIWLSAKRWNSCVSLLTSLVYSMPSS